MFCSIWFIAVALCTISWIMVDYTPRGKEKPLLSGFIHDSTIYGTTGGIYLLISWSKVFD